jgi:hypothetical protein
MSPLQTKEEEEPAKEAFNGNAFAQFFFGPGWPRALAILSRSVEPVEKNPFTHCWGWSATNPSSVSLTSLITIQTQTKVVWGRAF